MLHSTVQDSSLMPVDTVTFSKPGVISDWVCGQEAQCVWNAAHLIE